MKIRLSQIALVTGIVDLIIRQAKERGIKNLTVSTAKLNAVIKAATDITLEFDREDVMATPGMGLGAWLRSDDTGLSSRAMAYRIHRMGGADFKDEQAHPHDPSDFGRCHRFLEAVPGSRERIGQMVTVSPVWARLVEHWDELTALYLEELPSGKSPKLFARMKELGC